jgi:hypothetical protein
MNKEKLTCDKCSKQWERISSRGRKPKLCPNCTSDSPPVLIHKPSTSNQPTPKVTKSINADVVYPAPSKWNCKSCDAKLEVGVGIKEAPFHKCPKRAMRMIVLELVG